MTRHLLESFLHRLTLTPHHDDFILKGGVLLAAYGVRRATKDADANAISADVTPDHLSRVVEHIAQLDPGDGVSFDLQTLHIAQIRDDAQYPRVPHPHHRQHRPVEGRMRVGRLDR